MPSFGFHLCVLVFQGDEGMHTSLRQQVVNFMVSNEADFAPFVEDDESFGTYTSRMKKV